MKRQQEEMNKRLEEIKKKAEEKRFSLKLLQAHQGLEEASFERQIVEEVERGSYLPP